MAEPSMRIVRVALALAIAVFVLPGSVLATVVGAVDADSGAAAVAVAVLGAALSFGLAMAAWSIWPGHAKRNTRRAKAVFGAIAAAAAVGGIAWHYAWNHGLPADQSAKIVKLSDAISCSQTDWAMEDANGGKATIYDCLVLTIRSPSNARLTSRCMIYENGRALDETVAAQRLFQRRRELAGAPQCLSRTS
jgi:hypothetical protein